jgi:glycosyltransferase involved in cell wall biosynthesis
MRVIQASFRRDQSGQRPHELLTAWPALTDVARAASGAGVEVSIVVPHGETVTLECAGVDVHFQPNVLDRVRAVAPDILHVHGLAFAGAAPARRLPERTRVIVQDHGGAVPASWRRVRLRWGLRHVRAALFTAHAQAAPFESVLPKRARVFEVLESSTRFTPADQQAARRRTGIYGAPCALWIGRLNQNKDPLTVLRAVRQAALYLPDLQLWCCYTSTELLATMRDQIDGDPILRNRVHLLGRVSHDCVEDLARAADFFLAASHAEGSGFALIEALACGVTPVLTDIPSFRWITGNGAIGALLPIGDHQGMANALVQLAEARAERRREAVLAHFATRLSFAAIGHQLKYAYEAVIE